MHILKFYEGPIIKKLRSLRDNRWVIGDKFPKYTLGTRVDTRVNWIKRYVYNE